MQVLDTARHTRLSTIFCFSCDTVIDNNCCSHPISSVAVVAEISLRSPRKLFIFFLKIYICTGFKGPKVNNFILTKKVPCLYRCDMYSVQRVVFLWTKNDYMKFFPKAPIAMPSTPLPAATKKIIESINEAGAFFPIWDAYTSNKALGRQIQKSAPPPPPPPAVLTEGDLLRKVCPHKYLHEYKL